VKIEQKKFFSRCIQLIGVASLCLSACRVKIIQNQIPYELAKLCAMNETLLNNGGERTDIASIIMSSPVPFGAYTISLDEEGKVSAIGPNGEIIATNPDGSVYFKEPGNKSRRGQDINTVVEKDDELQFLRNCSHPDKPVEPIPNK